jgi:hypothetical protein
VTCRRRRPRGVLPRTLTGSQPGAPATAVRPAVSTPNRNPVWWELEAGEPIKALANVVISTIRNEALLRIRESTAPTVE